MSFIYNLIYVALPAIKFSSSRHLHHLTNVIHLNCSFSNFIPPPYRTVTIFSLLSEFTHHASDVIKEIFYNFVDIAWHLSQSSVLITLLVFNLIAQHHWGSDVACISPFSLSEVPYNFIYLQRMLSLVNLIETYGFPTTLQRRFKVLKKITSHETMLDTISSYPLHETHKPFTNHSM